MSAAVRVLRAEAPADRSQWLAYATTAGADPHSFPGFVELFANAGERARALHIAIADGEWLLPFIERPLPQWSPITGTDITSPYGYGGPFHIVGRADTVAALRAVGHWATEAGHVSAFLRLSANVADALEGKDRPPWIKDSGEIIVVDAARNPEQRWREYEHKVRKNVNKALRAGCDTTHGTDRQHWLAFRTIYESTMIRRNAEERYRFAPSFFAALRNAIPEGHEIILTVDARGEAISAELLLIGRRVAYSFLGGTLADAFSYAPNDLLKVRATDLLADRGVSSYVLGGGYIRGDGIFRYKRSFAPRGVRPFRTAQIIGDKTRYMQLQQTASASSDFFPAYRDY